MSNPTLRVVEGSLRGQTIELRHSSVLVGRSSSCNVTVTGYNELSRRHARFFWDGQAWAVEDHESKNGVLVQGQRVKYQRLHGGETIKLGDFVVEFQLPQGASPEIRPQPKSSSPWIGLSVVGILAVFGVIAVVSMLGNTKKEVSLDEWKDSVVLVQTEEGEGTGFCFQRGDLIVTNHHVVASALDMDGHVKVIAYSGTRKQAVVDGEVVLSDRQLDLAFVRFQNSSVNLRPFVLGSTESLKSRQKLVAMGFPAGSASAPSGSSPAVSTATAEVQKVEKDPVTDGATLLQVGTQMTFGSSGGPLINDAGQVVGVIFSGIPGGPTYARTTDAVKQLLAEQRDVSNRIPESRSPR